MRRDTHLRALIATAVLLLAACSESAPGLQVGTDASQGIGATTAVTASVSAAEWAVENLDWPSPVPGSTYQLMTLSHVGAVQLALAGQTTRPDNAPYPDTDSWRSNDGVQWTHVPLPNLVDGIRITPYGFENVEVNGDTVYAVSLVASRIVDPGNPDGMGQRADPSEPVGALWWSTDAGLTWQRTSETVPSRFDSAAMVDGTLWIGGALGGYPAMTAAVWSFDGAALHQRGTFGEPAEFSVVSSVSESDGDPIAGVADQSYAVSEYRFDGGAWASTGAELPPYAGTTETPIDLGLDGPMSASGPVLDTGTYTVVRGNAQHRHDLRFCFADPTSCRTSQLTVAFRANEAGADGSWSQLELPNGFQPSYRLGPQLVGDELIIYETDANGVPTRRAVLDLAAGPPPAVVHTEPPPLPAPEFDGTLEPGVLEAAEVVAACGGSYLTANGKDLSARDALTDVESTDWAQFRVDDSGSEGPVHYFYGLLELMADGRVELRATTGQHIGWFDTAIPPEYYCG